MGGVLKLIVVVRQIYNSMNFLAASLSSLPLGEGFLRDSGRLSLDVDICMLLILSPKLSASFMIKMYKYCHPRELKS